MAETLDIPPLLDEDSAAKILGVRPETLNNWRHNGRVALPFIRVGRAIRYRPSDVANFLRENTVQPAAPVTA